MTNILPVFVVIAIIVVIILTELIKKLDKKDIFKGYRVWIPAILSVVVTFLLALGGFFPPSQGFFWQPVIFSISIFAYEAVLKKITAALKGD